MKSVTNSFAKLALLAFILAGVLTVNYLQAAWNDPGVGTISATNTEPPVNVGTVDQVKDSGLALNGRILALDGTVGALTAPDGDLELDIEGEIGAEQYCNGNGTECFTTDQIGLTAFGGMYSTAGTGACVKGNYLADGGCFCPTGYTDHQVATGLTGAVESIFYCTKD